jgi:hypothetical protein
VVGGTATPESNVQKLKDARAAFESKLQGLKLQMGTAGSADISVSFDPGYQGIGTFTITTANNPFSSALATLKTVLRAFCTVVLGVYFVMAIWRTLRQY